MKTQLVMMVLGALSLWMEPSAKNEITGTWSTVNEEMKIEIYAKGDARYGKIVWMADPTNRIGEPRTDINNPDETLRSRPLMGMDMLYDLHYTDGVWKGKLYGVRRGITTDVEVKQVNDNLEVEVSYRGFSRKQIWSKATK